MKLFKKRDILTPGIFRLSAIVIICFLINIFVFKLFGYENNEAYQTINTIFVIFTFYLTLDLFYKNTNLAKNLSSPPIELVKIEHILKDDKSGIESFAVLKNNTPNSITVKSVITPGINNYSTVNSSGIKKELVSTMLSKSMDIRVSAGSVESVKIVDSSFEFIESQQFYSLNKEIKEEPSSKFPKDYDNFRVFFTYNFLGEEKYLKTSVNYHDYRSFLKDHNKDLSFKNKNTELRSIYIFLKKDFGPFLHASSYFKITDSKIESFSIRNLDESWSISTNKVSPIPDDDRSKMLYTVQGFFFKNEKTLPLENFGAIVLDYPGFTYYKSYKNRFKPGEPYVYEYIDNCYINTDHSIINKLETLEKKFIDEKSKFDIEKAVNLINSQNYTSGQARLLQLTKDLNIQKITWSVHGGASSRIKLWDDNILKYKYIEASKNCLVISEK